MMTRSSKNTWWLHLLSYLNLKGLLPLKLDEKYSLLFCMQVGHLIMSWMPWNLSFRYIHCFGQFTPKMKANGMTSFMECMLFYLSGNNLFKLHVSVSSADSCNTLQSKSVNALDFWPHLILFLGIGKTPINQPMILTCNYL